VAWREIETFLTHTQASEAASEVSGSKEKAIENGISTLWTEDELTLLLEKIRSYRVICKYQL